jgi:hypothetical protein
VAFRLHLTVDLAFSLNYKIFGRERKLYWMTGKNSYFRVFVSPFLKSETVETNSEIPSEANAKIIPNKGIRASKSLGRFIFSILKSLINHPKT